MNDKRMLHPLRALALDLKQLRLVDKPNDVLARSIALDEPPWRVDEATNAFTDRKKTFGLVGSQTCSTTSGSLKRVTERRCLTPLLNFGCARARAQGVAGT